MRRRKPRVVWLPPDPHNRIGTTGENAVPDTTSIGNTTVEIPNNFIPGESSGKAIPLVGDLQNAEQYVPGLGVVGAPSLSDMYNSGYRLRRICGHVFLALVQQADPQGAQFATANIMVTVGFQVARVDTSGNPVDVQAQNPDILVNQDNPWIWRRSWILTNYAQLESVNRPQIFMGSTNNVGYSLREGSFVDQKTARIIGPDERLFMDISATALDGDGGATLSNFVIVNWNLRALGSLKSNLGNRRNASR